MPRRRWAPNCTWKRCCCAMKSMPRSPSPASTVRSAIARRVLFPEGAPIAIHADRHRIRQLFAILVGNAIRATDANGRIWINGTPEGEQVVVRVSDNGDGLGGQRLDDLFELFTAATLPVDEAESRVGMELVRTIVDLHGGTVQARSAGTGKGSEFTVRLPLPPPGAALD